MDKYLGQDIKKLGFGLMRLPELENGDIDIEQLKKMVDHFIAEGFTYFDTAYVYHGGKSEKAIKEALVTRYPRESYQLVTKQATWLCKNEEDMQNLFDKQLERTGAGYFDFYLLHSLQKGRLEHADSINAWDFVLKLKEKGLVKHIGFSFHDNAEMLDGILSKHPEVEFVQLQINYGDWESNVVQSRKCYEVVRKYNKPLLVMEPLKGGALTMLTPEARDIFKTANPEASIASWGLRFAASLDSMITVLSGMSTLEQMVENTKAMKVFKPLTDDERSVIDRVNQKLSELPLVPCTGCKYCVPGCPQEIKIPNIFHLYNAYTMYRELAPLKRNYGVQTTTHPASSCIACGACETICPQHIDIINQLQNASKVFDN